MLNVKFIVYTHPPPPTHTCIYICIYMCVCVCVYIYKKYIMQRSGVCCQKYASLKDTEVKAIRNVG